MNTDKIYAEHIANEYSVKKTTKVVALKKLDKKVKRPPSVFAYVFGVLSALVLGAGMCLVMGEIGPGGAAGIALGVITGLAGIAGASVNYPIYKKWLAVRKERYAGDIIALAKEISEKIDDSNESTKANTNVGRGAE